MLGKFILFTFLTAIAQGHQDPWGDIHPQVKVMDGKFAIDFNNSSRNRDSDYSEEKPLMRVIYNADGTLFAPRHPIGRKRSHTEMGPAGLYGMTVTLGESTLIFGSERSSQPGYILKRADGNLSKVALPWPEKTFLDLFEDVIATPEGIAITGKGIEDNRDETLGFHWFPHGGTGPPVKVDIGKTACIYDFPVASNLAFAGGRFWVGLMRPADEKIKLALWSWKPGEKEGRVEFPDSPGDWNSHLSLAAIGDRLCLAYHCVTPDKRGLEDSRIVTVFRKAD